MKHQLPKQCIVTGIGTEVGKTVVSAILVETLKAHYWKPIQAGDLEYSDTMKVKDWVSVPQVTFYPEAYRLTQPMSPHAAAKRDQVSIVLKDIQLPHTDAPLIVEGAGGLMVPLNDRDLIIDMIEFLQLPVILVSRNYLGSINHTLLSVQALQYRKIPIAGIIFNGELNPDTESYILKYSQLPCLARVREESVVGSEMVYRYALEWQERLEVCT